MDDYKDRVRQERDELAEKVRKLSDFLSCNPPVDALELGLLHNQLSVMQPYLEILDDRISRF